MWACKCECCNPVSQIMDESVTTAWLCVCRAYDSSLDFPTATERRVYPIVLERAAWPVRSAVRPLLPPSAFQTPLAAPLAGSGQLRKAPSGYKLCACGTGANHECLLCFMVSMQGTPWVQLPHAWQNWRSCFLGALCFSCMALNFFGSSSFILLLIIHPLPFILSSF